MLRKEHGGLMNPETRVNLRSATLGREARPFPWLSDSPIKCCRRVFDLLRVPFSLRAWVPHSPDKMQ